MDNSQLKPGYKQTEVGVIPEDWGVVTLGELGTWMGGGTPSMSNPAFWNGSIPWVSSGDVKQSVLTDTPNKITKLGVEKSSTKILPEGSVIVVMRSGILRKYFPVALLAKPMAINQDIKGIIPSDKVYRKFLCLSLEFSGEEILNTSLKSGTTVESVEFSWLKSFQIPLPPSTEQRAIAEALSDVDALIAALDRLIAKKRDIKQGAMQQLLTGQRRLTRFCKGQGYKQAEVGVIPEDWNLIKIGDHFEFKNGLNKAKEFFGQGTPIVNYMDVFNETDLTDRNIRGRVTVTRNELKAYEVRKGDVFFTRTSETVEEVGITAVVTADVVNTVFSGFILRARSKNDQLDISFKEYCFSSSLVRKQITSRSSYTTRALTNGRLLSQVQIPLPPLAEQQAIAQILSDMDAEIEALERQRDKTRAIKQGMMQELLTGKTRLL